LVIGNWGLGLGIWGLGFGTWDLGFGVWDLELGAWHLIFAIFNLNFTRIRVVLLGDAKISPFGGLSCACDMVYTQASFGRTKCQMTRGKLQIAK
jgi:hypothetical protein